MKNKLRIGVLFDNENVPAWSYKMLSEIHHASSSEIVLLIDNGIHKKTIPSHLVYDLYTKLDRKCFKISPDSLELKSLRLLFDFGVLAIDDENKIKEYNIDILIQLEPKHLNKEVLNASKYGVWHYHFGDIKNTYDTPAIFWEVIESKGEVGMTLVMQTESKKKILATSYSLTDNLSVTRTQNRYFWKAGSILPRKIDELYTLGDALFFNKTNKLNQNSDFFLNEKKSIPTNGKVLFKLAKFKLKRILNILMSFFYFDQWILLFNFDDEDATLKNFSRFKKLLPPKDRFWADPHVIKKNGTYYIFIEELIYKQNKGFISVIEMDKEGNYKAPVVILEKEYHLSFPFIFEDNGIIYMIPESKQNNNIQLYKCIDFPYTWELETILMDNVEAVDTVITKKDGKYWLFTNMINNTGASFYDELYLFSSNSLVSNAWKSHPDNPIVSDVKNARMAGKIFKLDDQLYRPSQNCSNHYGYGMQVNRIVQLNEISYIEETINTIHPNWDKNIKSTHSLAISDKLRVIDAQLRRRK